jgi:PAS domain S-box-containing protein
MTRSLLTSPAAAPETPAPRPRTAFDAGGLVLSGGLLLMLGGVVFAAWATDNLEYVQFDLTLPPPHYNTALGFLVWGAGFVAVARRKYRPARVAATVLLAFGSVTAVGTVADIGLDRWLFTPSAALVRSPAGGCVPAMSVAFGLAAAAVLLIARRSPTDLHCRLVALIGLILAVGGPAVFIAARMGVANSRGVHPTAGGMFGVTVAGFGLLASAFRARRPAFAIGRALPVLVGLAGVVVTSVLWAELQDEQNRRVQRQVQFEADHIRRTALEGLKQEVGNLAELAERWPRLTPAEAKSDAGSYVGERPACLALAAVESEQSFTWVDARLGIPPSFKLADLGAGDTLAAAIRQGKPVVVRPPRSHTHNMWVFVVYAPHRANEPEAGGLLSVHLCGKLFETILGTGTSASYAIDVSDGSGSLYGRYSVDTEHRGRWGETLPFAFDGFDWSVTVWPTADVLARESLSLPRLALVIGLFTTTLLAVAVRLAQTARRRAAELEAEVRERELTQRALRLSEEKYRTLIENLGQGIFLQDGDHRYVAVNTQFCQSVGRAEAEIVGRTEAELFDPRRAAQLAAEVTTVLADGRRVESEEEDVSDGRTRNVRRVLTPVRDASGRITGALGICWDVTEQRQFEAHIHQASKMDAIGQLAGGIAHDFNNLLTAILGNLELVLPNLTPGHPARGLVDSAITAASRSASLTRRLLGFSRQHQLDWAPTDVNQIVEEVVALLRLSASRWTSPPRGGR